MSVPAGIERLKELLCGCASDAVEQEILTELTRAEMGVYRDPETFCTHVLDHLELLEHGCAIRGAWLTDDGKEALAWMRANQGRLLS